MRLITAVLISAALSLPAPAGSRRLRHALYNASRTAFIGANVADAHSSYGMLETNPALGRGRFGGRQVAIKAGIAGGWLLFQSIVNRHHRADTPFTVLNFGASGALGIIAHHNYALKRGVP